MNTTPNITAMELAALRAMTECDFFTDVADYPDEWASINCPIDEVSNNFTAQGYECASLGGVVASLVKKGLVTSETYTGSIYLLDTGVAVVREKLGTVTTH